MGTHHKDVRRDAPSPEEAAKIVAELEEELTYAAREHGPYSREHRQVQQQLIVARRRLDAVTREAKKREDQAKLSASEIVDRMMGR